MEKVTDEEVKELLGLEPVSLEEVQAACEHSIKGKTACPVKQVIAIRKDLRMRRGKEVAQGAHASIAFMTNRLRQKAYAEGHGDDWGVDALARFSQAEWQWIEGNFRKICVIVHSEEELLSIYKDAKEAGLVAELIEDSGLTEFGGVPTYTAVAIGPDYDEKIDPVTGHLPLY